MVKGQVSIDYIGGAAVFFISIIFIVTATLNIVPEFTEGIRHDRLETQGWSISNTLLKNTGYWDDGSTEGFDWHRQVESGDEEDVRAVGLEKENGYGVDREKLDTLLSGDFDYTTLKNDVLSTEYDFNKKFTEYVVIDSSNQEQGDVFPDGVDGTVGYESIEGKGYYFVAEDLGDDGFRVHVGEYDEDSGEIDYIYEVEDSEVLELGEDELEYKLDIVFSGILQTNGDLIILEKELGSYGRDIELAADEMVSIRRFSNIGSSILRVDMRVWQP